MNARVVFLAFVIGLLVVFVLAVTDDGRSYDFGHGDHVPAQKVGIAPFDHVASHPPGVVTAQSSGRPRPADVSATGAIPDLIRAVFSQFGIHATERAVSVFGCETGGTFDPHATGSLGERGIAQIHPVHIARVERLGFTWDQMYEALPNLTVAADLFAEQGWAPWSCA